LKAGTVDRVIDSLSQTNDAQKLTLVAQDLLGLQKYISAQIWTNSARNATASSASSTHNSIDLSGDPSFKKSLLFEKAEEKQRSSSIHSSPNDDRGETHSTWASNYEGQSVISSKFKNTGYL
jgi:hypothetical protein